MNKTYSRINWEDYPSNQTPLNENNLNKIDYSLNEVDNRVIAIETSKLDRSSANEMVTNFELDSSTGIITITKFDGTVTKYDTSLEKVAINFEYDPVTQQFVITLDDGTKQYIDLSDLVDTYSFSDSGTIAFSNNGKDISANIKQNSITDEMIESGYLSNIRIAAGEATNSANQASASANSAKISEDNARKSEANSLISESNANDSAISAKNSEDNAKQSENNASLSALSAGNSAESAQLSSESAKNSEDNAKQSENISVSKANEANGYASASNTNAQKSVANAILSESYAKGGTGTRQGEDTDNAYYYMQQAKQISGGIPTKLSEMENDVGFITSTVNNLVYYYTTSVVYTKSEVDTLISNIVTFDILPVEELPTENISTHTIYLVPISGSSTNAYEEYIYVKNSWELIGSTEVDLTNYLQKNGDGSQLTNTFSESSSFLNLNSGETLGISLGKIMKAISLLSNHIENVSRLATSTEYGHVKVDSSLNNSSYNPVENKAVYSAIQQRLEKSGDGSNVTISFTESTSLAKPSTGETLSALLGKIAKMYTDFSVKDATWFGTCSTARNETNKIASCSGFKLEVGSRIAIRFTDTGTANPTSGNLTLNVNSTGAKSIVDGKSNKTVLTYSSCERFYDNQVHEFVYDGTYWVWMSRDNDTTDTAGAGNNVGKKLYLTGTLSQSTGVSYSNSNCYIGTDNELYSGGKKVSHASDVGVWIGSYTISSGSTSFDITNQEIAESSIIDVYYAESSKGIVQNAVASYTQEAGKLTINFENALADAVTISNVKVVNP